MKNTAKILFNSGLAVILGVFSASAAFAQVVPQVQTNSAISNQDNSAVLNGSLSNLGTDGNVSVYFQWGTDVSYGNQTTNTTQLSAGAFNQTIYNLIPNTTYHFRAIAQNGYGINYGQDVTFYSSGYNNGYINGANSVQTNSATYISNFQATLNGNFSPTGSYYTGNSTNYVYFQWGTTTGYGNQTPMQSLSYANSFMQNIENLNPGTTYHFRAVAQGSYGTIYGQDMTFYTSGSNNGNNYYGSGSLTVTKQVIDLSSGNLNWASSVNANPGDILSFGITLQANGQDVHNVLVSDVLPGNLTSNGNILINTNPYVGGNIASGITVGTVYINQPVVVTYQVRVAPTADFPYGATTMTSSAAITGSEIGTQTASASVVVNKTLVYGAATTATNVSTGLTNNFLTESFFLPLLMIVLGLWFYFSGNACKFADKLKLKLKK